MGEMAYLETWRKHASRDYEVRYDEAGHTKGQEDGLSSVWYHQPRRCSTPPAVIPGCSVESTTFFACHICGVIDFASPCLYDETSFFAFSRPDVETKRVLMPHCQRSGLCLGNHCGLPTTPASGEAAPFVSSPRISNLSGLFHTAPVGIKVILGGGKVAIAGERGGHDGVMMWRTGLRPEIGQQRRYGSTRTGKAVDLEMPRLEVERSGQDSISLDLRPIDKVRDKHTRSSINKLECHFIWE